MARETPIVRAQKPTTHEKTVRHRYSSSLTFASFVGRGRGFARPDSDRKSRKDFRQDSQDLTGFKSDLLILLNPVNPV